MSSNRLSGRADQEEDEYEYEYDESETQVCSRRKKHSGETHELMTEKHAKLGRHSTST